jgi:hypothetical protein
MMNLQRLNCDFGIGNRALYNAGSADSERAGYLRGLEAALSHCDADSYEFDAIQRLIDAEKP